MAIHTELPIHKTASALYGVAIEATRHMPRDFKGTLGVDVRKEISDIAILIMRANSAKDKTPHIEIILERVETLNLLMRACHDSHLISHKIYARAISLVGSIGRQAGGWKKQPVVPASSLVTSSSRR